MPRIMFQDVVCPRDRSTRSRYTLPLSFAIHTSAVAVLIVVPLVATDVLPTPRSVMEFVTPFVPAVPAAPPVRPARAPSPVRDNSGAAPLVAPEAIGVESGVVFEPGEIEIAGVDSIVGDVGIGRVNVEPAPALHVAAPVPLIAGGNIKAPARTKYVAPAYPELARRARVQGIVIIEAMIGADGRVEQARVGRSQPLLDDAALAAVRQWEYTPTLLNGRPTPVIMTVTVVFRLQ
jgi:periplasmic protein TonB